MSYVRLVDEANGLAVYFDDVHGLDPDQIDFPGSMFFRETKVASGLDRTKPHTLNLSMNFVNGPSNDLVKVSVDGKLLHTGTSWEDYYRFDPEASAEPTPRL